MIHPPAVEIGSYINVESQSRPRQRLPLATSKVKYEPTSPILELIYPYACFDYFLHKRIFRIKIFRSIRQHLDVTTY